MLQSKTSLFDVLNYSFLFVLTLVTFYPFWTTLVVATSSSDGFFSSFYHVIPNSFSLESFAEALSLPTIYTSFGISVLVTVAGTALSLFLTSMGAYVLSKGDLEGRNFMFRMIIFTMFFSGGLVPLYILLTQMGLRNNILVLFVPSAMNTFNMILMKNYFATAVPHSLEDSARIDGLNEFQILFRIVLPTSMPIVATISLFYSVGYWNNWFMAMLFVSNDNLMPLALVLRNLIQSARSLYVPPTVIPQMVKAAVIIISIVPIILVYPFIQKHFVKGIMLGAIKE